MIRVRDVVLVHFALNLDDELTRGDVAAKTGVHANTVWEALTTMVTDGLLRTRSAGRKGVLLYRPGPALVRMCGRLTEGPK